MIDRITPELVERQVESVTYTVLPDGRTTVCQLTLHSGFTVVGMASCMYIKNMQADIGQGIAYSNALDKLAEFEAYRIRHVQHALQAMVV